MKYLVCLLLPVVFSCTSVKLSIPSAFKEQATAFHIKGARNNKIAYAGFRTSRIKRGMHLKYPGWSGWNWDHVLENMALNRVGAGVGVSTEKEKARFRYKLFEDNVEVEVYGHEKSTTRSAWLQLPQLPGLSTSLERPDEYNYIFSSVIKIDTAAITGKWKLVMSNVWERKKDSIKSILTMLQRNEYGVATNTADSIFINPVSIQEAEGRNGQKGKLPFKLLGGYELSTGDGVIAIIDLIGHNVWVYNELNKKDRLLVACITTALFARKVGGARW